MFRAQDIVFDSVGDMRLWEKVQFLPLNSLDEDPSMLLCKLQDYLNFSVEITVSRTEVKNKSHFDVKWNSSAYRSLMELN
ncbi:hypothetical protein HK098_003037 [Nowakowskiella sp. JEL0407]|nr:hypothetical protein HK098_003037 [Nowakowskiella sp. JEL0407]